MAGESTNFMASVANLSQVYPAPLRYHIDVVMNPDTFRETLISFHSSMGTRFMYVFNTISIYIFVNFFKCLLKKCIRQSSQVNFLKINSGASPLAFH